MVSLTVGISVPVQCMFLVVASIPQSPYGSNFRINYFQGGIMREPFPVFESCILVVEYRLDYHFCSPWFNQRVCICFAEVYVCC